MEIRLSTNSQDNPSDFSIVVDAITFGSSHATEWIRYSYNLADFVNPGTTVYLAFKEHISDNVNQGAAFFLDNVNYSQENYILTQLGIDNNPLKNNKSLLGYNVFLNDMESPVATGLTASEFMFTDLTNGLHTAGVQAIYSTGSSAIVTTSFTFDNQATYYDVVFRVHMHEFENFDPEVPVFIAGDMSNWAIPGSQPESQLMVVSTVDPMIYEKTLTLAEGIYQYKYYLNEGWDGAEWDEGENRVVIVDSHKTINDVFGQPSLWVTPTIISGLDIFPNPANRILNINSEDNILRVRIINMLGQEIYQDFPGKESLHLDVTRFQDGMYLIQVFTSRGMTTTKLQITK
jgi:hypothetical protein